MTYVIEPYLFWKGHYRQYFENLLGKKDTKYIYCNEKNMSYGSSIFIKYSNYKYESSFLSFIMSRILNSFKALNYLNKNIKSNDTVYFLEFEPFSALYFSIVNKNKKIKIIQTIHSVDRMKYSNRVKDLISRIQRFLFKKSIHALNKFNTTFVVHYEYHYDALNNIIGDDAKIKIIDYPSPDVQIENAQSLANQKSLLIFGLVREDKGIYEFLEKAKAMNFKITIAGKILDQRVKKFEKDFVFIDKFINKDELNQLYESHDFALIPYGNDYTGGAGPLKDAFAYGKPVVVSNHKVFNRLVLSNNLGIVFNNTNDLQKKVDAIDNDLYQNLSKNCIKYAKNNTWLAMRKHYFEISSEDKL